MTPAPVPIPTGWCWSAEGELWRVELSLDADTADVWRHFWRALFDLVCEPEEARRIGTVNAFYRCWTAKEALLKATRAGIGEGLKSIDVAKAKAKAQVPPGRVPG